MIELNLNPELLDKLIVLAKSYRLTVEQFIEERLEDLYG